MGLTLHIPDGQWRPIARRARSSKDGIWHELEDAPPLVEVQRQRERGQVLTALRYSAEVVEVLMRPAPGAEA